MVPTKSEKQSGNGVEPAGDYRVDANVGSVLEKQQRWSEEPGFSAW